MAAFSLSSHGLSSVNASFVSTFALFIGTPDISGVRAPAENLTLT